MTRYNLVRYDYAMKDGDILECRSVIIGPAEQDTMPPAPESMTRRGIEYLSVYTIEYRYC